MGYSIAFMATDLGRAGAETQMVRLAISLKERGVNVRGIITLVPMIAFQDELRRADISVISLGMRRGMPDPRPVLILFQTLREWRPDILVNFLFHANILGRVMGRWAHIPVIISSIRSENFGGRARDVLMRCTDWLGHLTTTNSHIVAARLVERHVVPARRLHVIPNGLPIEQYRVNAVVRTRLRQELAVDEQTFLWLAAGRLAHRKDYPTLLQAMRYLVDQHPRSQLRIAGKGELRAALERQVDDLRLRGYVRFTGERDDLPCLLQAADALVLSSIWEGLPNIVMEALATGIPVVATDVGGIQEIVTDNESALLVPARAPEALAAAMRRLVEMPTDARARIGRHGQRHIADHFGLASVLDQWDALFHAQLGVANIHPVEDER